MNTKHIKISASKLFPSGAWQVSATIGFERYQKVYYFFSKREAIALFRAEFCTN